MDTTTTRPRRASAALLATAAAATAFAMTACGGGDGDGPQAQADPPQAQFQKPELVDAGRDIFRYDTFGDEAKWTDVLGMNTVIESAVDPLTAASVGLKIDVAQLPDAVTAGVLDGSIPLDDPQTTLALLSLDAVVGVKASVSRDGAGKLHLDRVGITCALCHSTVSRDLDLPVAGTAVNLRGIVGQRLDGWPNRELNPGAIIALSPALDAPTRALLNSWGPGKYDPRWNFDGKSNPTVIPPAFGLSQLTKAIFTGDADANHEPDGPVAYWNRYVSVTQMGGQGRFSDPRLAGRLGGYHDVDNTDGGKLPDLVTSKLPALQAYQYSIAAPAAPAGSFDTAAAARGKTVFNGTANCASCHSGEYFTDATEGKLHPIDATAAADKDYALRSATRLWRTSPLKGVWSHAPYFHDGSAATLADVVQAYDSKDRLGLTEAQKADLIEYLKSL